MKISSAFFPSVPMAAAFAPSFTSAFFAGSGRSFFALQNNVICSSKERASDIRLEMVGGSSQMTYYGGGIEGGMRKRRRRGLEHLYDPETEINKYIQPPEPVYARSEGLDGSILVSGWLNPINDATVSSSSDQTMFDLLNYEDSAFTFNNIVAFSQDEAFARKRLLSRSARYTGLLNKLSFAQAVTPNGLPTVEQLKGVGSWLAHVEVDPTNPSQALNTLKEIGYLSSSANCVRNVAVLLSNAHFLSSSNVGECVDALSILDSNAVNQGVKFTVVSVGSLDENVPEGGRPYEINDFGTEAGILPADAAFSRAESYRLVAECLALQSGENKALTFQEVPGTPEELSTNVAAKLIRGLRQAGYTRPQEIHHMITAGVANYTATIEHYKQQVFEYENPDPAKVMAEKAERDRVDAANLAKAREESELKKQQEIEELARAWAKREYFRKSMGGAMFQSEEEYIHSVWDRAMFEGDMKYRMMHGMMTDERKELSDFLDKQARKEQAALKRAQESLGVKGGFE